MKPDLGTISCWAIVMHAPFGYVAIGHHGPEGLSINHPDHHFVRTSPIVRMEQVEGGFDIETQNSIYHLRGDCDDRNGRDMYRCLYAREPGTPKP